ncbi:hypothetical protein SCMU_19440 [Sinomonas cyclohexanicum]|uniref:Uncharacterized protein n=1 Tax=Sinomonas cyclohexanicum TaxID=322009 RepID=A0ABM7PV20_SINCY|nr:hypothetical protein [Corynebacterium cyclohexanicum]BCT76102.1 hypothetical protein SCMU_19440 [Corynebacterium cyclohexanicum]
MTTSLDLEFAALLDADLADMVPPSGFVSDSDPDGDLLYAGPTITSEDGTLTARIFWTPSGGTMVSVEADGDRPCPLGPAAEFSECVMLEAAAIRCHADAMPDDPRVTMRAEAAELRRSPRRLPRARWALPTINH